MPSAIAMLFKACQTGNVEALEECIKDAQCSNAHLHNGLMVASKSGQLAIVERLCAHPEIDPAAEDNKALVISANASHMDIVRALVNDGRVSISAQNYACVIAACRQRNWDAVSFFVDSGKLPAEVKSFVVQLAVVAGYEKAEQWLASDPSVEFRIYESCLAPFCVSYFSTRNLDAFRAIWRLFERRELVIDESIIYLPQEWSGHWKYHASIRQRTHDIWTVDQTFFY
jgi:hypothetical protein